MLTWVTEERGYELLQERFGAWKTSQKWIQFFKLQFFMCKNLCYATSNINPAVSMLITTNVLTLKQQTPGSFLQHSMFSDCPSTSHEFKPPCQQTSFNTTLNLYWLQGRSPLTDPALRPCCEKKISLQGSIKCHISAIMHSGEVKQEPNYLYKSLRHINHACDASMPNRQLHYTLLSDKMSCVNAADCESGNCCTVQQ